MKQPITYDLHEMRSQTKPNGDIYTKWISTKAYNKTFMQAKGLKTSFESQKNPYGTFFIPIKNGLNPIEVLLKRKKVYVQSKMDL